MGSTDTCNSEQVSEGGDMRVSQRSPFAVWYCPSRWLLAHQDTKANIQTLSSHMCLADLNNDGESLLALIDFKERSLLARASLEQAEAKQTGRDASKPLKCPFDCRLRVYRGQHLIYSHFLDDLPACLVASSINLANIDGGQQLATAGKSTQLATKGGEQATSRGRQQPLLTIAINDDIYFYHKLRPSHRLSLEDDECILDSLNKSEVDAWRMVKQNKVDVETMRELLIGLRDELGSQELSSHSINFLSLSSSEARKQYLLAWKYKRLENGIGENIMSMDTICCACARLKYSSPISKSGDFGQTRDRGDTQLVSNARWNRVVDIQREGLVVGTEDRHLLIYELRPARTRLECHYRLASTADHILVERRSPTDFASSKLELKSLTYKVLVSCRNCRIYSIDQSYVVEKKASPCKVVELVALKCNVLDMCWTGIDGGGQKEGGCSGQLFVVACLDRRAYCFSSSTGRCHWIVDVELPITGIVCLPRLPVGSEEASLVGIGSQGNRIDFYISSSGRIVDSIYFAHNDFPQALAFGRFGREDNCLCLVTNLGHLLIFILKRTAKFAHGQCLSSAASFASDTLADCSQLFQQRSAASVAQSLAAEQETKTGQLLTSLNRSANLPSNFSLSKSDPSSAVDQLIDSVLHSDHQCDKISAENALKAHLKAAQLPVPVKSREFVNQLLEQSRQSGPISRLFARQMIKLRDQLKSTIERNQSGQLKASGSSTDNPGNNRIMLGEVVGLGNIYRCSLSMRLRLQPLLAKYQAQIMKHYASLGNQAHIAWSLCCLIRPTLAPNESNSKRFFIRPARFVLTLERSKVDAEDLKGGSMFEGAIEFKLTIPDQISALEPIQGESATLDVRLMLQWSSQKLGMPTTLIRKPICVQSVNVPTC